MDKNEFNIALKEVLGETTSAKLASAAGSLSMLDNLGVG